MPNLLKKNGTYKVITFAHGGADQVQIPLDHWAEGHNPGRARSDKLKNMLSKVAFSTRCVMEFFR